MTVTKNTLIGDLLANDMNTARFLFEMGMHCVGCPASAMESLEEACAVPRCGCRRTGSKN